MQEAMLADGRDEEMENEREDGGGWKTGEEWRIGEGGDGKWNAGVVELERWNAGDGRCKQEGGVRWKLGTGQLRHGKKVQQNSIQYTLCIHYIYLDTSGSYPVKNAGREER